MTQINLQIIVLFLLSVIAIFVIKFILRRFRNRELNDKEIAENITDLYNSIIKFDKVKAFKSFIKISPYFDKGESAMYYAKNFNNGIFVVMGLDIVKIYWEKLGDEFLDILIKYKSFERRNIAIEEIDRMANSIKNVIK